jgi:hypothetical protein
MRFAMVATIIIAFAAVACGARTEAFQNPFVHNHL